MSNVTDVYHRAIKKKINNLPNSEIIFIRVIILLHVYGCAF